MRNLSDVRSSFQKGNYSEEGIKKFLKEMGEKYYKINLLQFTMNYYDNFLFFVDTKLSKEAEKIFLRINYFVQRGILKLEETDKGVLEAEILNLRKEITERADALTSYQSSFWNFRYALTRKYSESEEKVPADRDGIAKEILEFIFENDDNFTINHKISEVIKCLPIRYTRGKFLELLENAIEQYKEADKASFERFLYGIRQAGMLGFEKDKGYYPDLEESLNQMKSLEISKLSKAEVFLATEKAGDILSFCESGLEELLRLVQEVNAVYALLTLPRGEVEIEDEKACISALYDSYMRLELFDEEYEKRVDRLFEKLEGKIEDIYDEGLMEGDMILESNPAFLEKLGELGLLKECDKIRKCHLLLKSDFADIKKGEENEKLSLKEFEEMKKNILEGFENVFKEVKTPVRRGMMAQVLSALPVYFENRTEVMNYVRDALSACDNLEELKTSIEAIHTLRREYDYC